MNRLDENRGRVTRAEVIIRSVVRISGNQWKIHRVKLHKDLIVKIAVKFNQVRCSEFQIEFCVRLDVRARLKTFLYVTVTVTATVTVSLIEYS